VRQVVWVVGSSPGEATTVRVVTETVSPGLGYRTRVTVLGAPVVAVVGATAGTVVAGVDAGVTSAAAVVVVVAAGILTDVVVVAVAVEVGCVAGWTTWRARTSCVRPTNDGAAANRFWLFSGLCTAVAWTAPGPAAVVAAAGPAVEDGFDVLDEQAVTIATTAPRLAARA